MMLIPHTLTDEDGGEAFTLTDGDIGEALKSLGVETMDEAARLGRKIFPLLDVTKVEELASSFECVSAHEYDAYRQAGACLQKALCLHLMRPELRRLWDRAFMEKEALEQVLPEASSSPGGRVRL